MGLISFTNIVVDDFNYGKKRLGQRYVYFLSHMHSDHYQGITPLWNFGDIYCSPVSKRLLLSKFPNILAKVHALELNQAHTIVLSERQNIVVKVHLYDANHCPGSVMFVFEGYMGRIVHTGDMRWNNHMFETMPALFPPELRTKDLANCAADVDELIFDNTYCDEIFNFPIRSKALKMIVEIIEQARLRAVERIYICVDSLGKEEIMITLAKHFHTRIIVNQQRYEWLQCMDGVDIDLFSVNESEGWIEVARRNTTHNSSKIVTIQLTGWANIQNYVTTDNMNYLVPYSLHSNYLELEYFVRGVQPAVLKTVVSNEHAKSEKVNRISQYSSYMITISHLKQRGVEFFQERYTRPEKKSQQYLQFFNNLQKQRDIYDMLGVEKEVLDSGAVEFGEKDAQDQRFKNKNNTGSITLDSFFLAAALQRAPQDQFKTQENLDAVSNKKRVFDPKKLGITQTENAPRKRCAQ